MSKKNQFLDEFVNGVTNAISDIRQKVVEQPWFGQSQNSMTPAREANHYHHYDVTNNPSNNFYHTNDIQDNSATKYNGFDTYCAQQNGQSLEEYNEMKTKEYEQAHALDMQQEQQQER